MAQIEGLSAVLGTCDQRDYLGGYVGGGLDRVGSIDFYIIDDCAILEHIFKIDKAAVKDTLKEIVGVVKMDFPTVMRLDYI